VKVLFTVNDNGNPESITNHYLLQAMKIALLLFSLSASASAFAPRSGGRAAFSAARRPLAMVASGTSSSTARPDVTRAVADAVDAAKRYGAASPEARVAWEAVEELSASDNR
jgi:hypothetical protein